MDDGVGVFVAPSGKDGATGTKGNPVRSIADGVAKAAADRKPRVYVCEGSYGAAVTIAQPVSIYGGLSCAWARSDAKPKLAPSKGVGLRIANVSGAVVVEDVEVVGAADASTPGASSIAAFVSDSTDVTFRNTVVTAQDGSAGAPAGNASNYSAAPRAELASRRAPEP